MSSTSKTANFGLNLWEASDGVCRGDFNADNAIIDDAVGAIPVRKLKEITTSEAAESVEIDLSDIDMSEYTELWIENSLGVTHASGGSACFRLNNITSASYGYTYLSSPQIYFVTSSSFESLYTGLYKFMLGDALCWSVPQFAVSGTIQTSALLPADWTSITFFVSSGTIPAGGKVRIYGVKKI